MSKKRLGIDSRKTERKYHVAQTESGFFSADTDYEDYLDNPGTVDGFLDEPVRTGTI